MEGYKVLSLQFIREFPSDKWATHYSDHHHSKIQTREHAINTDPGPQDTFRVAFQHLWCRPYRSNNYTGAFIIYDKYFLALLVSEKISQNMVTINEPTIFVRIIIIINNAWKYSPWVMKHPVLYLPWIIRCFWAIFLKFAKYILFF